MPPIVPPAMAATGEPFPVLDVRDPGFAFKVVLPVANGVTDGEVLELCADGLLAALVCPTLDAVKLGL